MSIRANSDVSASWEHELPMIQVTVLYENMESGLRAKALMQHAESGIDFPAEFRLEYWRFDWLKEALLGHLASNTAKDSALVIIASTTTVLPRQVEDWIHAWAKVRANHPSALIVLLPGDPGNPESRESLRERLYGMAQSEQVNVFCESFGAAGEKEGLRISSATSEPERLPRRRSRRRRIRRACPGLDRFRKSNPPGDSRN